ncbi:hypothetical protein EDB85DRAFT_1818316, partial [Lactarius pseudohatsudake]
YPSHVVIHHRPFNSTTALSRAPRQVTVWGLVDGEANMKVFFPVPAFVYFYPRRSTTPNIEGRHIFTIGRDRFDITARSLRQVFPLYSEALSLGIDFGVIVFDIRSNWGAEITSL